MAPSYKPVTLTFETRPTDAYYLITAHAILEGNIDNDEWQVPDFDDAIRLIHYFLDILTDIQPKHVELSLTETHARLWHHITKAYQAARHKAQQQARQELED